MNSNRICDLLSIRYPIIQAPMSWISNAELAAAVSNAGGLGIIGPNAGAKTLTRDVDETAERLRAQIRRTKELTDKPFGVNVMVFERDEIYSDRCVEVILEEGIAMASLCGDHPERYIKKLKDAGIKVFHRPLAVNNVEEAKRVEKLGVDAIIAVGYEGGGHLGADCIPTFVLVPQIVDAVNKIPVVAGGGIVDARGMISALALGAEGIFMGTRFIATRECPAHISYKQAIVNANDISTVTFSGIVGVCRAFKTPLVEQFVKMDKIGKATEEESAKLHRHENLPWLNGDWTMSAFPCSAAVGMIKEIKSAGEVVDDIISEARRISKNLCELNF